MVRLKVLIVEEDWLKLQEKKTFIRDAEKEYCVEPVGVSWARCDV
jgi:hypothetical protein